MPRTPIPLDERRPGPLWRNRSFMLMWVSVAAAGFGDRLMEMAAMPMLGVRENNAQAAAIQSSIYFFFFLPWLVITPIGGWLGDTLPRKFILFACDLGRALVLFYAFTLIPWGLRAKDLPQASRWEVYMVLAGVGALAAIFSPVKSATVPSVVPVAQLQPANSIVLGIGVIASLVGFFIGGPLIDHHSVSAAILAATLAYGTSGWFFLLMKVKRHAGTPIQAPKGQLRRMAGAVSHIWRHRPVRELSVLAILCWTVANVVAVALSALCKHQYGIPEEHFMSYLSGMMGTTGCGMLAGALWVAWVNTRREAGVAIVACMLPTGVCLLLLALNTSYHVALVLGFLIGFFGNAALIQVDVLTQSITPDYIRGRVFGVRDMLCMVSAVAVHFVVWQLGVGPRPIADRVMINALFVLALLTPLFAVLGFWRLVVLGPLPTPRANALIRLARLFCMVWHRLRWIGRHHVPATGPVILASNHTTGLDPILIQIATPRLVTFLMLESYRLRALDFVWREFPTIAMKEGSTTSAAARTMELSRRLEAGGVVGLFPEGRLQRTTRSLGPFAGGVAMLAKRTGAAIVPLWIDGTPRKRHMFWHFFWPSRSRVIFGRPFRADPARSHAEVTAELRQRMLELARLAAFRDMYCPNCRRDLTEAYSAGGNCCPGCGNPLWHGEAGVAQPA